jgi:hypothetical protein
MRMFTLAVEPWEFCPATRAALAGAAVAGRLMKVAASTAAAKPARIAQNLRDIKHFLPLCARNVPDVL